MSSDPQTSEPTPGPPFQVGDEIAFFSVSIANPDDLGWLRWEYAVIDDINPAAESFGFHFVSEPGKRWAQGMENIVRRSPAYYRWREAFEAVLAATGDQRKADDATMELHRLVVAEHPIYGPDAIAAGRARDIPER